MTSWRVTLRPRRPQPEPEREPEQQPQGRQQEQEREWEQVRPRQERDLSWPLPQGQDSWKQSSQQKLKQIWRWQETWRLQPQQQRRRMVIPLWAEEPAKAPLFSCPIR